MTLLSAGLSEQSLGWLRLVHRKAHTPDDWSEHGRPHESWGDPDPAVAHRRDLLASAFALGLMARRTPAWTEPYLAVFDQLIGRHTQWWAAHHNDGSRIEASMFDASLSVVLGLRSALGGDDRWSKPFEMFDGSSSTQSLMAQRCADADGRPPSLLAALALRLHRNCFDPNDQPPETSTDHDGHELETAALFAAALDTAEGRRLFDQAVATLDGTPTSLPLGSTLATLWWLARELDIGEFAGALAAAVEAARQPRWQGGAFAWHADPSDGHPRGELNALLAAAEVSTEQSLKALAAAPIDPCPQVVDVDLGDIGLHRAEWVDGNLHLGLRPVTENPQRFTYFRVVGAEPRMWDVHGVPDARIESRLSGLNVRVPLVSAEMSLIRSSY